MIPSIEIHSSVETDKTEKYMHYLSIIHNFYQPKKKIKSWNAQKNQDY